jgi:hypothetical protein
MQKLSPKEKEQSLMCGIRIYLQKNSSNQTRSGGTDATNHATSSSRDDGRHGSGGSTADNGRG